MPAHFALSEVAIVLTAIGAAIALMRKQLILPAFAVACFGTAAAIGVVRFGVGLQDELALLHASVSRLLGLAAAVALAIASLRSRGSAGDLRIVFALPIFAGATLYIAPWLVAPLFLLALLAALGATFRRSVVSRSGWLAPLGLALLLANALLVHRAPWLSEAAAWHAYHLLISLALAITTVGILCSHSSRLRTPS